MENASKALIIAGAILISILLIAVGMMVMNGANGGIDQAIASMSQNEKEMFNRPFTQYEGEKVSGSNVRALIGNIISNNSTNQEIEGKLVSITGDSSFTASEGALQTNEMSAYRAKINTGATYSVILSYSDAGLVNSVEIKRNATK